MLQHAGESQAICRARANNIFIHNKYICMYAHVQHQVPANVARAVACGSEGTAVTAIANVIFRQHNPGD